MFLMPSVATTTLCVFRTPDGDDERFGIEQPRSQPDGRQVQVLVEHRNHLIFGLGVQIYERDVQRLVLVRDPVIQEVLETRAWCRRPSDSAMITGPLKRDDR